MASTRRWTVSDGRTMISVLLVVVAVFLLCASIGALSWVMAALGLAVAAAGIGIFVLSALNSREFAYVPGTARVQNCSPPPANSASGRCVMQLIVHAPGGDDVAVRVRETGVPVAKWPYEGVTLPILVAIGDRRRVRVLWDNVRSHGDLFSGQPDASPAPEGGRGERRGRGYRADEGYPARGRPGDPDRMGSSLSDLLDDDATPDGDRMPPPSDEDTRVIELDLLDPTLFRHPAQDNDPDGDLDDHDLDDHDLDVEPDDAPFGGGVHAGPARSRGDDRTPRIPAQPGRTRDAPHRPVPPDDHLVTPDDDDRLTAPGDQESPDIAESPGIRESPGVALSPGAREAGAGSGAATARPGMMGSGPGATGSGPAKGAGPRRPSPRPRPRRGPAALVATPADAGAGAIAALPSGDLGATPDRDAPAGAGAGPDIMAASAGTAAAPVGAVASAPSQPVSPDTDHPSDTAPPDGVPSPAAPSGPGPSGTAPTDAGAPGAGSPGGTPPDVPAASGGGPPLPRRTAGRTAHPAPAMPRGGLRVENVLPADPAVPAIPGDGGGEHDVSDAYLAVTPPPGRSALHGRVRGLGVTLFVANLGTSVAFYRDRLGFSQVDVSRGSAVMESGDGRVVLRRVADMPPVDRRLVHLMLEVPDVHAAYEELRARGVQFVHRPRPVSRYDQLELWSAALRDPDGHGIALIRWDLLH